LIAEVAVGSVDVAHERETVEFVVVATKRLVGVDGCIAASAVDVAAGVEVAIEVEFVASVVTVTEVETLVFPPGPTQEIV
jgi:hypothetical protein